MVKENNSPKETWRMTDAGTAYQAREERFYTGEQPLSVLLLTPKEKPSCVVQLLHGMLEHKEVYLPMMEYLIDNGFACVIHDMRGHGASVNSEEDFGYMTDSNGLCLVEDAYKVTQLARQQFGDLPLVLFGHSMGSLTARVYLQYHDAEIDGLVLCGPPYEMKGLGAAKTYLKLLALKKGMKGYSEMAENLCFKPYAQAFINEGPMAWVMKSETAQKRRAEDPLCDRPFTINGFLNLISLADLAFKKKDWNVEHATLPVLFAAGEEDPCAGNREQFKKTVLFLNHTGYSNTCWKRYSGMRHNLFEEDDKERFLVDLVRFIRERVLNKEKA